VSEKKKMRRGQKRENVALNMERREVLSKEEEEREERGAGE